MTDSNVKTANAFSQLPTYERLALFNALDYADVDHPLEAAEFILTVNQAIRQLPSLSEETENILKITDRILKGDPYILAQFFDPEDEESVEDSMEEMDEDDFMYSYASNDILLLEGTVHILDKTSCSYAASRLNGMVNLFVVFDKTECAKLRMRTKKTGLERGTLVIPPDDVSMPTLHVVSRSDLQWMQENMPEES